MRWDYFLVSFLSFLIKFDLEFLYISEIKAGLLAANCTLWWRLWRGGQWINCFLSWSWAPSPSTYGQTAELILKQTHAAPLSYRPIQWIFPAKSHITIQLLTLANFQFHYHNLLFIWWFDSIVLYTILSVLPSCTPTVQSSLYQSTFILILLLYLYFILFLYIFLCHLCVVLVQVSVNLLL